MNFCSFVLSTSEFPRRHSTEIWHKNRMIFFRFRSIRLHLQACTNLREFSDLKTVIEQHKNITEFLVRKSTVEEFFRAPH